MNNININSIRKLPTPYEIKNNYNISYEDTLFINNCRSTINNILSNKNNKKLIVVGIVLFIIMKCLEYAKSIKQYMTEFQNIYIVMRVYFEKPRTINGWKGFLYDPELDGSNKIDIGIIQTRKLLLK